MGYSGNLSQQFDNTSWGNHLELCSSHGMFQPAHDHEPHNSHCRWCKVRVLMFQLSVQCQASLVLVIGQQWSHCIYFWECEPRTNRTACSGTHVNTFTPPAISHLKYIIRIVPPFQKQKFLIKLHTSKNENNVWLCSMRMLQAVHSKVQSSSRSWYNIQLAKTFPVPDAEGLVMHS